ncbi:MAG: formylglycine-generating enzyme family protein [Desulfobulbaceae bacterium]|nr:formylglycine-generating enzyme family protein [Desulfobulbaceae bacterium]
MRYKFIFALLTFSISFSVLNPPTSKGSESLNIKQPVPEKKRETWQEPVTGMTFVKIEAGCFEMGQSPNEQRLLKRDSGINNFEKYFADELPQHNVCVDEFWMGITEVTQGEWQKIMEYNPAVFQDGPDYPVEMVSWDDTQLFINKLNTVSNTSQFRLPSEAEWEYAARAGTTTIYNTGDAIKGTEANFNGTFPFGLNLRDEYRKTPVPVGSFPANAFGLHDMHGNVWEWCNDWYQAGYYKQSVKQNPAGPESAQMKVLRGGSWFRYSAHIRSATRYENKPSGQYADTGFRLVKSPRRISSDSGSPILFDKDF